LIHEFVYPVYVEQQFEPTLSPDEHEKFMWLSYGEAREKLFTENNKRSLSILS